MVRDTVNSSFLPVWSPDGGKMAFTSSRTGSNQIWVMNKDGTDQHRVTQDDKREFFYPSWSPDGQQLAFQGLDPVRVDYDLYASHLDGSDLRQLTSVPIDEEQPQWSPDGSRILYKAKLPEGQQLFTITPDGQDKRQLTHDRSDHFQAVWSPHGHRIAYVSDQDTPPGWPTPRYEVYLMDADGQNCHRVTNEGADGAFNPAFRHDGQKLAYTYRMKNSEIATINPDGTGRALLTDLPTDDMWPEWSPDDNTVAFTSMRPNAHMEMHKVGAGGGTVAPVMARKLDARLPTWSPDGSTIAFTAHHNGRGEDILAVDADGSHLRRLTPSPESSWRGGAPGGCTPLGAATPQLGH